MSMNYAGFDRSVHDASHTALVVPYGLGKCCETRPQTGGDLLS